MRNTIKAFRALSDETRLRVLNVLLERECCVCEVMQALDISQSKASRALSALYDAGFLKLKKDGLWSLYSIDEAGTSGYLAQLTAAVRMALQDNDEAAQDKVRLRQAQRAGTGCAVRPKGRAVQRSVELIGRRS